MSSSKSKQNTDGFTILEVVIALAIIGLIMMLMFLAIPALQRSGRNNERKQDVSTVLQAASRFALNHGGDFPGIAPYKSPTDSEYFLKGYKLTYYQNTPSLNDIEIVEQTRSSAVFKDPVTNIEKLRIVNYAKCDPDTPGKTLAIAADYRDIAAQYVIEVSGGTAGRCTQL